MIKLHIAEVLQEKGITKTEFARIMGIQKQNVNSLLETNNIRKIEEKQTGTDAYINYSNVKNHIANAFLTLFASTYGIKPEELNTIEEPAVEETQTTENTAFGVDNTDLEDGYQVTKTSINSLEVKWANDEINKCMAE